MANLIRSAKSGNKWTENELRAYNVAINFQNTRSFFGDAPLPDPSGPPEFLTILDADDAADADSHFLLTQLDLAMIPNEPDDSAVGDFAVALFDLLDIPRGLEVYALAKSYGS
jgi:hypothetical protein